MSSKKLLVDEIAENVFLALGEGLVGILGVLLFDFVPELVFAALKLGTSDDLIVDASDDLFHHLAGGLRRAGCGGRGRGRRLCRRLAGGLRGGLSDRDGGQAGETNQKQTKQSEINSNKPKFLHKCIGPPRLLSPCFLGLRAKGGYRPMEYFTPSEPNLRGSTLVWTH